MPAIVAAVACGRSGAPSGEETPEPTPSGTPSATPSPFCDGGDPDLLACWRFDGNLDDESPYALALSNGAIAYDTEGAVGEAVALSAASFLTLPGTAAWVGSSSAVSFEGWIKMSALPAVRYGFVDRAPGTGYAAFVYAGGELRCGSRAIVQTTSSVIPSGTWVHIACVDDATSTSAWVNGVRHVSVLDSSLLFMNAGAQRFYLGENGPGGDDQFLGSLDEVRFLSRALGSAEIAASVSRIE